MQTNSALEANSNTSATVASNANDPAALRNEFMTLMIAQINNQDPTDPLDANEYVNQLAQFSQVESLENVVQNQSTQMIMMENQGIVQSAQLIGKQAMVPASEFSVDGQAINGKVYLQNTAEKLSIEVSDSSGELLHTMELGTQEAGDIAFTFDAEALGLPAGDYQIKAVATNGEDSITADTFMQATIQKIHFSSAKGTMLAELSNGIAPTSVLNISEVS